MSERVPLHVVTLGPTGTDAEHAALSLGQNVGLCSSFREAMSVAYHTNVTALVACGYIDRINEVVTDSWVNLHFSYIDRMEVIDTFYLPTKPMCIARRNDRSNLSSVALHPATEELARLYCPKAVRHYVSNKPLAVGLAVNGDTDACIGSIDVVSMYDCLQVVRVFRPQMVWALYARCESDQERLRSMKYSETHGVAP